MDQLLCPIFGCSLNDKVNRRRFLVQAGVTAGGICAAIPSEAISGQNDFWSRPRSLWLYRPETGDTVREVYWYNGQLHEPGYRAICRALRDVKANQAVAMDIGLLDVLRGVQGWLETYGQHKPIITHSGYRSRSTNSQIEGAARNSKHLLGQAWDGHIEDVSASRLAAFAQYLRGGGVGFYQGRGFVHLDSGNVRYWRGG